jgi:hypothetical protein
MTGLLSPGVAGAADEPAPEATGTFTSLTYNVAGLPEGLSGSNPTVNTPQISPLLNAYDLVLVQEDWIDTSGVNFFHDDLIAQATHPYLSTPAQPPLGQDPRRPEALIADGLNRLSRFPFGPLTRQMWPNCFGGADQSDGGAADCLSQKGFSVARTTIAPGVEVDVYNLHAEAGSTALDDQYSAEDFEVLAAYITANSAGRAVLVGGDYNLHTDRALDRSIFDEFLAETGLTDVCAVVDCGADADEIDKFVFRSGGGVTLQPLTHTFERDRFVRASDGGPLSDHDALSVTWQWSELPAAIDVAFRKNDKPLRATGGGSIPVALLTAPGFGADAVDPRTTCFGDAGDPTQRDCTVDKVAYRDVDGDGDPDTVLRYLRSEAGIDPGDTAACLTFPLPTGGLYEACDAVLAK